MRLSKRAAITLGGCLDIVEVEPHAVASMVRQLIVAELHVGSDGPPIDFGLGRRQVFVSAGLNSWVVEFLDSNPALCTSAESLERLLCALIEQRDPNLVDQEVWEAATFVADR